MSQLLGTIAILGFIVCIVMTIVSAVMKSGKVKKWAIGIGVCFLLFIVAVAIPSNPITPTTVPVKTPEQRAKEKVDAAKISTSDKELLKKSYSTFDVQQRTQFAEIEEKYAKLADVEKADIKTDFERMSNERTAQVAKWAEEEKKQAEEKAAAEKAAAAAKITAIKAEAKTIPYKEIARTPDTYKDARVNYTGEVIQVQESGNKVALRVNITKNSYGYEDTVYVLYTKKDGEGRILDKDIINLWGLSSGLYTYKTVMGSEMTIPKIDAKIIEVVK